MDELMEMINASKGKKDECRDNPEAEQIFADAYEADSHMWEGDNIISKEDCRKYEDWIEGQKDEWHINWRDNPEAEKSFSDENEAESQMLDEDNIISKTDCAIYEVCFEVLLNDAAYHSVLDGLKEKVQNCEVYHAEIGTRCETLKVSKIIGHQLLETDHFTSEGVGDKMKELAKQCVILKEALHHTSSTLGEFPSPKQSLGDVNEVEFWIEEMLIDNSCKDPSNVQTNYKNHQALEAKVVQKAGLIKMEEKLTENQQYAGSEDANGTCNLKLVQEWEYLTTKSSEEHEKLEEAITQMMHTTTVAHEKNVREVNKQAFKESESWDEDSIKDKTHSNNHSKKKLLMDSEDHDHKMTVLQKRRTEQQMEADVVSCNPDIQALQNTGVKLQSNSNLMADEFKDRPQCLSENWDQLRGMATELGQKQNNSSVCQQFASVVKQKAWMTHKQHLTSLDKLWTIMATVLMELKSWPKLYIYLAILLSHIGAAFPLEIRASYKTSFKCADGSYALISGDNLTLEFDYGHSFSELQSFHLYEMVKLRHMFDYESAAGQAFMKDKENRLTSFELTDTGIKLAIPDIDKGKDYGKYKGDVEIGGDYKQIIIEVKEIHDPPLEVKITISNIVEKIVSLEEGFEEYTFEASAESYTAITCSPVKILWVSPSKRSLPICQAEVEGEATACPLTLKESNMTIDECMTLEVYAEQYGVRSESKAYTVCYNSTKEHSGSAESIFMQVIIGMSVAIFMLVVIIIIMVVCLIRKGNNEQYRPTSQDVEDGCGPANGLKRIPSNVSSKIKACCSDSESENE